MKIKKDSWMVWMIDQAYDTKPKSLCTFFWLLVGSIVFMPLCYPIFLYNIYAGVIRKDKWSTHHYGIGIMLTIISFAASSSYFSHYYLRKEYTQWTPLIWSPVFLILILVGVATFAGMIFGIIHVVIKYEDKRDEREYARRKLQFQAPLKEKKPNVIIEFIKAKKQKVCPIIEYTED